MTLLSQDRQSRPQDLFFGGERETSLGWIRIRRTFYPQSAQFKLRFEAKVKSGGQFALSQFSVRKGHCDMQDEKDMFCDFESDSCLFTPELNSPVPFKRVQAEELWAADFYDHTLKSIQGHLYGVSLKADEQGESVLRYRRSLPVEKVCVLFWANLNAKVRFITEIMDEEFDNQDEEAEENVGRRMLWKTLDQRQPQNYWYQNEYEFELPRMTTWSLNFKIKYEKEAEKSDGFVAVDDVQVIRGECTVATYACTFEVPCLLQRYANEMFTYTSDAGTHELRTYGFYYWEVVDAKIGHIFDHTIDNQFGKYLLFSNFGMKSQAVYHFNKKYLAQRASQMCLQLFYQYFEPNGESIKLFVVVGAGDQSRRRLVTRVPLVPPIKQWNRVQVNIELNEDENGKDGVVVYLLAEGEANAFAKMAIDDIRLDDGLCQLKEVLFSCEDPGATLISKTKKCNFVVDCPGGKDEQNCGTCDFRQGMCEWERVKQEEGKESIVRWVHKELPPIPKFEGKPTGPVLRTELDTFSVVSKDIVQSPLLINSGAQCTIRLSYVCIECRLRLHIRRFIDQTVYGKKIDDNKGKSLSIGKETIFFTNEKTEQVLNTQVRIGRMEGPFLLQFEETYRSKNRYELAIIDLKMINCKANADVPKQGGCSSNQFQCENRGCIPNANRCDFEGKLLVLKLFVLFVGLD